MKKQILFLLIPFLTSAAWAQDTPPPSQYLKSVNGQFYMDTRDSSIWQYMGTPYGWQKSARFKDVLLYGDTKFTTDLGVYLPAGYTFGKYANGATIPANGKTAAQVIQDAIKVIIPPTYISPTVTISGTPTPTPSEPYEIGTQLNIVLSSIFTQNNGGAPNSTTYYKGSTAITGNTDAINLVSPISYSVQKGYDQGNCIPNNVQVIDCVGRINTGTATSGSITYTPGYRRYAVWLSDTTNIRTTAFNDALIYNLPLYSTISSSKTFSFSTGPATNKFLAIVYVSSAGALTSLKINGVGSIGAFNNVTRNFVNAKGYTLNARIYWNTQAQTTTGYDIDTQ